MTLMNWVIIALVLVGGWWLWDEVRENGLMGSISGATSRVGRSVTRTRAMSIAGFGGGILFGKTLLLIVLGMFGGFGLYAAVAGLFSATWTKALLGLVVVALAIWVMDEEAEESS